MVATIERRPIRQGDVLLVPVDPPASAARVEDVRGVRIPGEHSGHVHVLEAPVYDTPQGRLLHLEQSSVLTTVRADTGELWDERHQSVTVPAGWWEPVPQREYQPRAAPRRRSIVD